MEPGTVNEQSFHNITKADPVEVLLFVAVGWNGLHFSFVNALSNRMDFHPHWNPVRQHLKPYTFHCVRALGWNTNSATGHTFQIKDHVCEFLSIHQARSANTRYLQHWRKFVQNSASAGEITAVTGNFVQAMLTADMLTKAVNEGFEQMAGEALSDDQYIADLTWAVEVLEAPAEPFSIDADPDEPEWLAELRDWCDSQG